MGKQVKVYRYNEKTGTEDAFDAEVLSVAQGTVMRINGEITYNFPGRIAFPEIPPNLIAKPTLVWMLDGGQAKQKVEVTYLTAEPRLERRLRVRHQRHGHRRRSHRLGHPQQHHRHLLRERQAQARRRRRPARLPTGAGPWAAP